MSSHSEMVSFESDEHLREVFVKLNKLRERDKYCQVKLICGEQEFWMHKDILIASSAFFRQLIEPDKQQSIYAINLDWINPDILDIVIDYLYTGKVSIDVKNYQELINAADVFQINSLLENCCQFIKLNVTVDNFDKYLHCVDDVTNKKSLLKFFAEFFEHNFIDLIKDKWPRLLHLHYEFFKVFLSIERDSDSEQEQLIFQLVIDWSRNDLTTRADYFSDLFEYIDIDLLKFDIVQQQIHKNKWLKDDDKFLYVFKFLKKRDLKNKIKSERTKIVINGFGENKVFIYDIEEKHLCSGAPLKQTRRFSHSCVVNNKIFIVGGCAGRSYLNTVEKYDPHSNKWLPCNGMSSPRSQSKTIAVNDCVYVFGGYIGCFLKTAEVYDVNDNHWYDLPPMPNGRCDFGVVSVQNTIFLIGGASEVDNSKAVFSFNIATRKWRKLPNLSTEIFKPHAAVIDGVIYLFDAVNGQLFTYNVKTNCLTTRASLMSGRDGCSMVEHRGMLYVIGGFNNLSGIEIYDATLNKWTNFQFKSDITFFNHSSSIITL